MEFTFTQHALQQLFKRSLSLEQVKQAVSAGKVIADYPNDKPYPSKLALFKMTDSPLHVVYAINDK